MADRYPLRMIAIDWTKDRDAIILRAAKDGDSPDNLFNPTSDLGDLWLTLKASKHNVSATNLTLFGTEIDPIKGKAKAIQGAIPNDKNPEWAYAYKPEQLLAFGVPANLFMGANLGLRGGPPWFSVSLLPYVGKQRAPRKSNALPKPTIVRVTAAPVAQPAVASLPKRQRAQ